PRDGTLLLGEFRTSSEPDSAASRRAAFVRGANPAQIWSTPLAGTGVVFGAGLDLTGHALAILDGSPRFGSGAISAQWFGPDGAGHLRDPPALGGQGWDPDPAARGPGVAVRPRSAALPADVSLVPGDVPLGGRRIGASQRKLDPERRALARIGRDADAPAARL